MSHSWLPSLLPLSSMFSKTCSDSLCFYGCMLHYNGKKAEAKNQTDQNGGGTNKSAIT